MIDQAAIEAEWATCPQAQLHNWPTNKRSGRRLALYSVGKSYWADKCPGCGRYLIFTKKEARRTQ